ncbi:hypothetical protein [Nocardioides donggukensis]|uniref:Uncharacterized protein n=1 Tax=Nocardioides donggukensis TaxID=2774019 RepID=A0A927K5S7_9ACTN|nr:hypothetical protein [Nocardioides donggukensis]MBD8870333.1 hypothetical protein [Nocardioides donggukensis]
MALLTHEDSAQVLCTPCRLGIHSCCSSRTLVCDCADESHPDDAPNAGGDLRPEWDAWR